MMPVSLRFLLAEVPSQVALLGPPSQYRIPNQVAAEYTHAHSWKTCCGFRDALFCRLWVFLFILTSDPWHQQGNFLHTTAAQWMFSLSFQNKTKQSLLFYLSFLKFYNNRKKVVDSINIKTIFKWYNLEKEAPPTSFFALDTQPSSFWSQSATRTRCSVTVRWAPAHLVFRWHSDIHYPSYIYTWN